MTDSSTPCSKKPPERRRFLQQAGGLAAGAWLALGAASVRAAEAEIRAASIIPSDDQYILNVDIAAELTPLLADVVARGVSLYFVTEFELSASRWYWLDEEVVSKTLTYRLSYQSLTRQYRLTTGALHQNFGSAEEALRTMLRIRNWGIADRNALRIGRSYNASLRFRLDVGELPKPLQVSAFGRKDWNLSSDWYRWTFVAAREAK
ncbi:MULTISPECIES: DUF4390 domain-containing protein [Zoogloea]|jgi:hypothetical protein|uniref:DUF4390 domain-containing protein n=1 Tax=Zoogloea oleivorans TaxID=1552750 RepID=A0A6C2CXH2_9RHOO|nr:MULTISPECIES: DUF4390 domain-containing protein [Zoogloea]MBP8134014.1 DUF4390 domain-containing protein [Zoogloea sp.]MBT9498074.1 DUF4390 domain-containing protein [Zoogloea sp.]MDD2668705.1 DUF4390 domain-containing protein [Zoogloea sp.]MDY0037573.1 DUF4390 domain-containing protein [Zoogloea oleivorans]TYC58466.1 DUF4390 domain-containing protein [Zoogloea oleivorans]